ncbi:hypothetical protein [uncultured Methylibium sp.]|uniref:hypothetical protein n=1 Tax=uncultured Methylibium sp. TaxID=381093 RepID=UPI0025F0F1DC|nr:hypothetical protein [uncultured Methylibium sp.]
MTVRRAERSSPGRPARLGVAGLCAALLGVGGLASCGGGGDNPLGNPPTIANPGGSSGQHLSYAYFQRCVYPILIAPLQINQSGNISTNTCAASGCHDDGAGTGGAFRVVAGATAVDVANPANTPDVIRATAMYRNFFSAQGSTLIGSPTQSRLLTKPLVLQVLHGGGQIFIDQQDPNARVFQYWISRPVPQGADEFSTAAYSMFTPADPNTGTCNTQ